ncbi:MAG TPA: Rrf2 family transcriptional regulator [Bryobacteraceae bacterium]|nr:Rrf2 family transcriptional regulator [Bryobacteraceae bacterium]
MQLTRAADYGVRAMVYLAGLPSHSRASIAELAKATESPEAFLTKVLQRLVSTGLIDSHRGPSGGFELRTPAAEIFLLDVVEAIEGPIQLNLCTGKCNGSPACGRQDWCAVHLVWQHAQAKLREILGAACIETLAQESKQRLAAIRDVPVHSI